MRRKRIYWRGRTWQIIRVDDIDLIETMLSGKMAQITTASSLILYRGDIPKDMAILCIFHEIGHELYPEWTVEPDKTSKSELGVFERDIKSLMDASGVDLSPLLVGDDDELLPDGSYRLRTDDDGTCIGVCRKTTEDEE